MAKIVYDAQTARELVEMGHEAMAIDAFDGEIRAGNLANVKLTALSMHPDTVIYLRDDPLAKMTKADLIAEVLRLRSELEDILQKH